MVIATHTHSRCIPRRISWLPAASSPRSALRSPSPRALDASPSGSPDIGTSQPSGLGSCPPTAPAVCASHPACSAPPLRSTPSSVAQIQASSTHLPVPQSPPPTHFPPAASLSPPPATLLPVSTAYIRHRSGSRGTLPRNSHRAHSSTASQMLTATNSLHP